MKATIWIKRENEDFWDGLPNKGGWVNMVINAIIMEEKRKLEFYEKNVLSDEAAQTEG